MVPFIMRDLGDLRRQELLATGEYFALLSNLPAAKRWDHRSPRHLAEALNQVMQSLASYCLRRAQALSIAGERR